MRITGKGCSLHGAEGVSPPLPFINVSGEEGRKLIEAGLAVAIDGVPEEKSTEAEVPAPVPPVADGATDDSAESGDSAESTDADRLAEIVEALDLIEEGDLVKSGARAGKPKVGAVEAVLGYSVTVGEVDAAVAAKESGA